MSEQRSDDVIRIARKVLLNELSSELSWRLVIHGLFASSITFAIAVFQQRKETDIAIAWLSLAVLYLLFHHTMIRARTVRNFFRSAFLLASIGFLWWGLIPLFHLSSEIATHFIFCLLIFSLGSLTLPGQAILPLYLALIVMTGFLLQSSSNPLLWGAITSFILLISLRSSLTHYSRFMTRVAIAVFSRLLDSASSKDMLLLLRWMLGHILAVRRVMIVPRYDEVSPLLEEQDIPEPISKESLRLLREYVDQTGSAAGVLKKNNIDGNIRAILSEYFTPFPYHLVFFRLAYVDEEGEDDILVFAPVNLWMYLGSLQKIFRQLYTFTSLVQYSFASEKRKFLSSSQFLDIEKNAEQLGSQFRDIVHRVNNAAQEMSIQSERLEDSLEKQDTLHAKEAVKLLQSNIQKLSFEVSDLQLIHELTRLRSLDRQDRIPSQHFLENCAAWRELYSTSLTFAVPQVLREDQRALQIVSEDYLGALLRTSFRYLQRQKSEVTVGMELKTYGQDEYLMVKIPSLSHQFGAQDDLLRVVTKAYERFAELSSGFCRCFPDGEIELEMLLVERERSQVVPDSDWILLVDDNPDVLSFYSGVAEALQVPFSTATSLATARERIQTRGKPMLLLTDIHVEDGTGIELARECREDFGEHFPIIVVSGAAEEEERGQVDEIGIQAFLMKPVRRRKLFQVVKEAIGK